MLPVELFQDVREYLLAHYEEPVLACGYFDINELVLDELEAAPEAPAEPQILKSMPMAAGRAKIRAQRMESKAVDIRDIVGELDESFVEMLLRKIDEKGITDADCYHRAQLNRSHFNKIKNDPDYHVKKSTVIALILALELGRAEADEMLRKAGYALSPSSKFDVIIEYCLENGITNVTTVNEILYEFDQELLGAGVRE